MQIQLSSAGLHLTMMQAMSTSPVPRHCGMSHALPLAHLLRTSEGGLKVGVADTAARMMPCHATIGADHTILAH